MRITAMNCTICNQPITLVPSAQERAAKHGGKASDYARLFRQHAECALQKREQETTELLLRQISEKPCRCTEDWSCIPCRAVAALAKQQEE